MRHFPTPTLDRRSLLRAAGRFGKTLAAGSLLSPGLSMLGPGAHALAKAPTPEPLVQPPEVRSRNGVLETTITAAPGQVRLGDHEFSGLLYNGAYVPPTLRARLGDTLRITFRNDLPDKPSNLHYHGMSVSPRRNSDNVFVHVHPGATFQYEVRIPASGRQGPGLFWYHPHAHGFVNDQILGGMSGGLVVDGMERLIPILQGLPERFSSSSTSSSARTTRSSRSTARSTPALRCAPARCSSGASRISGRRNSTNSTSKEWRFTSWRRMATRCRGRAS
jgi:suppressor of ftsI